MARLYSNENFPQQVVDRLHDLGHDVVTSHEAGNSGMAVPDEQVLDYAVRTGRALLTLNRRHFVALHQRSNAHAGIIVCTFDSDFDRQTQTIHGVLSQRADLQGQLLKVDRDC